MLIEPRNYFEALLNIKKGGYYENKENGVGESVGACPYTNSDITKTERCWHEHNLCACGRIPQTLSCSLWSKKRGIGSLYGKVPFP